MAHYNTAFTSPPTSTSADYKLINYNNNVGPPKDLGSSFHGGHSVANQAAGVNYSVANSFHGVLNHTGGNYSVVNHTGAGHSVVNHTGAVHSVVKRKESIHSGHFMISQFEVDEEEDEIMPQVPQDDIKMVTEPVNIGTIVDRRPIVPMRNRAQSNVIETSLTKLFECMSLAYR